MASIREHLDALTPAERYAIFEQSGALGSRGVGRAFVWDLAAGRVPSHEMDRYLSQGPDEGNDPGNWAIQDSLTSGDVVTDPLSAVVDLSEIVGEADLPFVETRDALSALDAATLIVSDESAAEFLIASALA